MDPLISGAGQGLAGLMSYLGGRGDQRMFKDWMKEGRAGLKGMLGVNIDPAQGAGFVRRQAAPALGQQANYMSKRGISGPLAKGAMFESLNNTLAQMMAPMWMQSQQSNQNKNLGIWQALLGQGTQGYAGA